MNPSFPSTPLTKVPGPDHTLKFLRMSGSLISSGLWSSALVIQILVVMPLAERRGAALKMTTSVKAPTIACLIVPPLDAGYTTQCGSEAAAEHSDDWAADFSSRVTTG